LIKITKNEDRIFTKLDILIMLYCYSIVDLVARWYSSAHIRRVTQHETIYI